MTIDTEHLRDLIRRAVPLPWQLATSNSWRRILSRDGAAVCSPCNQSDGHPDLHFPGGAEGPTAQLLIEAANALPALLDHIDAQQAEIDRHRRAAARWKKVAESAEGRVRDQAAEIARLRDAQAWQPIETAPHNETVLLGWRDWDDAWIEEVGMASWGWRNESVSNVSQHGRATHWMPLPAAPGALSGESHD